MKNKKTSVIIKRVKLLNAISWAIIILLNSYFFNKAEYHYTMFCILIVVAGVQISLIDYMAKILSDDKKCIAPEML